MRKTLLFTVVLTVMVILSLGATTFVNRVFVTNFPAVQPISGTVSVGNLPHDADGNVRVTGITAASPHLVGITQGTFPYIPQNIYQVIPTNSRVLTLSRACSAEFPGARACEVEDLLRSIPPPTTWTGPVWTVRIIDSRAELFCMTDDGNIDYCYNMDLPVACCGS